MSTYSLTFDNFDYGYPAPYDTDKTFVNSKAEAQKKIFQSCYDVMKMIVEREKDSKTCFDAKLAGLCLVDTEAEIRKAKSVTTLIAIAREFISVEIANDLSEINNYPLGEDELPLNLDSTKSFLQYSFIKGLNRPILTTTPDGLIQSDWDNEETKESVAIRFLGSENAWVTLRTNEIKGTTEIKLSSLFSSKSPLNLPSWANE